MKYSYIIVLTTLLFTLSASAADQGIHLFILSGQSNMCHLDPNQSFTPALAKHFGKAKVIVVKDAQGGKPIRRWHKNSKPSKAHKGRPIGDIYTRLLKKVNKAIKGKTLASVTFVWMQGEADAFSDGEGEDYATCLRGLQDQLRKDFNRNDINFVIGRISDYSNPRILPDWDLVRKAQVEVAESDPYSVWVDTDDLNDGKQGQCLHYTDEGSEILGKRFAEKAIALIDKK